MGMDVFGKNPTSEAGRYFRNNVWNWGPLADYVLAAAPEEAAACRYWHSNDGDGLDAAGAERLARRLQEEINADRTRQHEEMLKALPVERQYPRPFSVENVVQFVAFLRDCGGFKIC